MSFTRHYYERCCGFSRTPGGIHLRLLGCYERVAMCLTSENSPTTYCLLRGWGNKALSPWVAIPQRDKEATQMSEQARKIRHKSMPEWAEGLYYNSGNFNEVLVYHDEEAIYVEHLGKEDGVVRFTFEMIEGLKIVEEEGEHEDSPQ